MTRFEIVKKGFVRRVTNTDPTPIAAGPRCVVAPDGSLVCIYVVQSKLGINDFVPILARSTDGGATWKEEGPIWPELRGRYSLFLNLGRSASGELFLFGSRYLIDEPGETFWSDETQGLKYCELVWTSSTDSGRTWSKIDGLGIPIRNATSGPGAGSAEQTGPLCVTRDGRWIAIYSPYNTMDAAVKVDRNRVVGVMSSDRGDNWSSTNVMRFDEVESGGAEAWCIELADGRLLATSWHVNHSRAKDKPEFPNKYAMSLDGGTTWTPTRSTGVMGHTTALTALPDGRALFCYVQRGSKAAVGIWLGVVKPTPESFGLQHQEAVWKFGSATQGGAAEAGHDQWTSFNFGEPCVTLLPDGTLMLVAWYSDKTHGGIFYQKMKMVE